MLLLEHGDVMLIVENRCYCLIYTIRVSPIVMIYYHFQRYDSLQWLKQVVRFYHFQVHQCILMILCL